MYFSLQRNKFKCLLSVFTLLLSVGFLGLLCLSKPAHAQNQNTITLAIGEWPPFISNELPNYGPLSEIVRQSFKNVGIEVKFKLVPWKRGLQGTKHVAYDGTPGWGWNKERDSKFHFSDNILVQEDYIFYSKSKPLHAKTIDDLAGLKSGVLLGSMITDEFQPLLKNNQMIVIRNRTYEGLFKMMIRGRIDYIHLGKFVGIKTLHNALPQKEWETIGFLRNLTKPLPYHLVVSKNHKNGLKLIERFNVGLKALRQSGEYDRILEIIYHN